MRFEDIVGNDDIKLQLQIASQAAHINNYSVPHVLCAGQAGCGKTSMSKALAASLNTNLIKIPAESIKKTTDVLDLAEKMCYDGYTREGKIVGQMRPTVVFLDEIHKMSLGGQESLGMAMEEWYVANKNKWTGQIEEIWLPRFTVIGATTLEGKLSKPLRDRFKLIFYFSSYNKEESVNIVKMHAALKKIQVSDEGAAEIAQRGRGVPRILVGLLDNCAAATTVMRHEVVDAVSANAAFEIMGIDDTGLTKEDISVLKALYKSGIPVGLDTLSVITNISPQTIKDAKEPFLMQRDLLRRTGGGRVISKAGIEYLREYGYIESTRRFSNGK